VCPFRSDKRPSIAVRTTNLEKKACSTGSESARRVRIPLYKLRGGSILSGCESTVQDQQQNKKLVEMLPPDMHERIGGA
jgi:hypothetical protein